MVHYTFSYVETPFPVPHDDETYRYLKCKQQTTFEHLSNAGSHMRLFQGEINIGFLFKAQFISCELTEVMTVGGCLGEKDSMQQHEM